jgi:two-component system sensor histidine kinase KdpD
VISLEDTAVNELRSSKAPVGVRVPLFRRDLASGSQPGKAGITAASARSAVRYLQALFLTAVCTGVALPMYSRLAPVNVVMLYLLGTTVAALLLGRGPSALCAVTSVAAFDFFFVPPRFSFLVAEPQYVLTLGVMLVVALVIAELMASIRRKTERQIALTLEQCRLAELASNARAAAERAALRNTLLASISHDLRAPLTAIAGAGSLVAQTDHALDAHRRVVLGQLIEEKAREMTELLSNVLELTRLETATAPIHVEWQSLEELVSTAIRNKQACLDRWRVRTAIPVGFPMLYVDGQLVVQLLSNLLENASKYTPHGTSIVIHAEASVGEIRIVLQDDGPGFGDQDPAMLFETFERGHGGRARSGAGLGLAICRAIAHLHRGTIRAENAAGRGAKFVITLPLDQTTLSR